MLRWIRGRVPADLAEELTQQTFMQYWQWLLAAAAFPKSDKSLLLSIARSVCADHYRAIAARAVCVAIPEDFDLPDRADPITMVEWAQVLGMLGREDQILLAMRRQGYGSKEISLALGISGSAVRTRLQKVRKLLRKVLADLRLHRRQAYGIMTIEYVRWYPDEKVQCDLLFSAGNCVCWGAIFFCLCRGAGDFR